MNMKEKLESLGKNSIRLKIARKETYKLGSLESLHVDRVHFNRTLCSKDQSVHGNQYSFVFGFLCGGGNYGAIKIQRAVGT